MKQILFALSLLFCMSVSAQSNRTSGAEKVYDPVEEMPGFPGGMGALMQFLSENVKYPQGTGDYAIEGSVVCTFTVEKDGTLSDIRVSRSLDPLLDQEAIRVISIMPKWIPGKLYGKPCKTRFTLPVTFKRY